VNIFKLINLLSLSIALMCCVCCDNVHKDAAVCQLVALYWNIAGYTALGTINVHICACTCLVVFLMLYHQWTFMNNFKKIHKNFDVHESVHRVTIMKVTNKMQLYRLIYFSSQLYKFRAMFSSIIRSNRLYLQYLVVFTQVAAGWCLGWIEFIQCIQDTSREQTGWILPK